MDFLANDLVISFYLPFNFFFLMEFLTMILQHGLQYCCKWSLEALRTPNWLTGRSLLHPRQILLVGTSCALLDIRVLTKSYIYLVIQFLQYACLPSGDLLNVPNSSNGFSLLHLVHFFIFFYPSNFFTIS